MYSTGGAMMLFSLEMLFSHAAVLEHDEEVIRINAIAEELNALGDELCPECGYFIFSEDQKSLADGKGGVIVNALVTGYQPSKWSWQSECTYFATPLAAVSRSLPGISFLSTD